MMQCCCVPGCYNKAGMTSLRGSSRLSFHCFPQNNDRLAAQWRRCIGREDVSRRMRICSDHFLVSDFLGGGRHRKLRRGVIPSIIPATPSPLHTQTARMNVWKLHTPTALEVTAEDRACRDVASSSPSSRDSSPAPPTPSHHPQSPWSVQQHQQREAAALALLGLQTAETASWSQRETAAMGLLGLQSSSWSIQQRDAALGLLRLQAGQPSHISAPVQWQQQQREMAALGLLGLQTTCTPRSMQEQREAAAMGLLGLQHGFHVGQQLLNTSDPRQRGMLHSSFAQLMHMHALEHQYKLMQLHLLQRTASSSKD